MNENNKRNRSSSFSGSLPGNDQGGGTLKRRGSTGDLTTHQSSPPLVQQQHPQVQLAPQLPPPKPQRHALLSGLSAFDPNHSFAAAMELRAHKASPNSKYAPGHIFVESEEARQSVVALLTKKKTNNQNATEVTNIDHALSHIQVIGKQQNLGSGSDKDKLYVKGHGSPKNKDTISTTTITRKKEQSIFQESGFKQTHTAKQIAQNVEAVRGDLGANKLDIRMTSCGSAGGYTKNVDQLTQKVSFAPVDKANTFAGNLQQELDTLRANAHTVHGYRGDANSSFPSTRGQLVQTTHFRTTVKDDGSTHQITELPNLFQQHAEPQTVDRPVKRKVPANTLQTKNLTPPQPPVLPQSVEQASTPTSTAYGHKNGVTEQRFETRRSSTRVSMK